MQPDLNPPPADVKPLFLRAQQVATILGVSKTSVYALCAAKKLKHVKVGGAVRISPAHVEEYVRANTVAPTPAA